MFETIYLPSQRVRKGTVITTAGLSRFRNNPGIISQYPSRAYQSGITKVQDSIQTSSAAVIAAAAPFSIPIRNASYNLNADPNALYRTPRSGLLWRVVGKEGDCQERYIQNDKTDDYESSGSVPSHELSSEACGIRGHNRASSGLLGRNELRFRRRRLGGQRPWARRRRRCWLTQRRARRRSLNHRLQSGNRQLPVVGDRLIDQIIAFALLGDQDSVVTGGYVRAASDLLHHVPHERGLLADGQVLLNRIGIRNCRADDVQLILCFFDVFAVGIVAHQLLVILGRFIWLFLFLIGRASAEEYFVRQTKVLVLFQDLFQTILCALQALLVVNVSVVIVEAGDL